MRLYYRRFVKDFSTVAAPLYALTHKGAKYLWTLECQRAFEALPSSGSCPSLFLLHPVTKEPTCSTVMRAITVWACIVPRAVRN